MKRLFCTLFFFNSILVFSQAKKTPDVFEDAYVVTLKGDTVFGHIKLPKTKKIEIYQKISFRDKTKKIRLYSPDKIKGYGYNNYYYLSAFHDNKACFFKVLSTGKVLLFQTLYEVIEEGVASEIEEFCVMVDKENGQLRVLEQKSIKKQLKDVFKSNKLLVQKVNEQKEIPYNAETLESYFKEFNQTTNSN